MRVSKVMDNATHVAMYFGFYLKKPPVAMSRLKHYAGRDEIIMRYRIHRTKHEETLTLSGDKFMNASPGMCRRNGSGRRATAVF